MSLNSSKYSIGYKLMQIRVMKKSIWLICLIGMVFHACESPSPEIGPDPEPEPEIVETIIPTGDEQYLNLKSDYIFDQSKLLTFELNLPKEALSKIDADPTAEEYVEGSLTFEGETISPIGIRYKGSVGAFVGCLTGTDWANPSGSKTCTKLSMKVKINWNGSDQKFYGLRKLQFHSQNLDDSQMRERLAYHLFREMGVPAPRSVHARLMINGVYNGIYALTEQIDGRFTRYNFDDGEGNLYKEVWPITANGRPQAPTTFLQALKTNEDENPSVDLIRNFGQEIVDANDEELPDVIRKWMDVNKIIAYAAVDRTIRVDDGAFHWYCGGGGGCSNHNYYWYEEPSDEKLHLIPWDMDNTFENIIIDANPVTPIADDWGETQNNCNPFPYGRFNLPQRSAACDRLTYAWTLFEDEYAEKLAQFKAGPLSEAEVNANLDAWVEQIRVATLEASQNHGDALKIEEWEGAVNRLKNSLSFARF